MSTRWCTWTAEQLKIFGQKLFFFTEAELSLKPEAVGLYQSKWNVRVGKISPYSFSLWFLYWCGSLHRLWQDPKKFSFLIFFSALRQYVKSSLKSYSIYTRLIQSLGGIYPAQLIYTDGLTGIVCTASPQPNHTVWKCIKWADGSDTN